MIPLLVILGILAIAVPAWLSWHYAPLPRLTAPVALRYFLLCLLMFLCGLLALRDPLLVMWAPWALLAAALFSGALVVLLVDESCQN